MGRVNKPISVIMFITLFAALCFGVVFELNAAGNDKAYILPKLPPIPKSNPQTKKKILLGKMLFFDPRLSKDGTISCNSCHNIFNGGSDNRSLSAGIKAERGKRSAPTVFNAAFLSVQNWDGRADSLEAQILEPLTDPKVMGEQTHGQIIKRLKKIPPYRRYFQRAFGASDPVTIENLAKAIASYERTLVTPNSRFDLYLKGNKKKLTSLEVRGWARFKSTGCLTCHSGAAFAGPTLPDGQGFFMKFPTIPDTDYDDDYEFSDDQGRYQITDRDGDKNMFRVPTLRNIALTAPYFHNGSVKTLEKAVAVSAKVQLNKDLKKEEVAEIVAFLKTLTGSIPREARMIPTLPGTLGFVVTETE